MPTHLPTDDAADGAPPGQAGFYALYRREFAFVWATARRYGVPAHSLDDAVQDVFLTAHRRLDQLHFEVSARAWLHGVTRRVAARYRRSAGRLARRLAAVAAVPRGPAEPPQERLAAAEELGRLLAGLGRRTRAVFEMSELLGMSGPEIAGELGIPVSTVYSRVRLAREQLARELGAARLGGAIEGARERDRPPQEAVARGWALLVPGLGTTGAGAGVGLGVLATARGAAALAIVLATGAAAIAWPRLRPADAETVAAEAPIADTSPRDSARTRPLAAEAPAPAPMQEGVAAETTATATTSARPAAPARSTDDDRLAAEVALLDRARDALGRGDVAGSRAILGDHARRFPGGALVDLRGAIEVELLCREGLAPVAEARAAELVAAHPRSLVAQRFVGFECSE